MAYASPADFVATYGDKEAIQLSNRGNAAATTVNNSVLQRFLDAASGLIDSYLSGRYELPLLPAQAEPLRIHCLRLARCEADSIKPREACTRNCDETMAWLEKVALGKIQLGLPGLPQQEDLAGSTTGNRARFKSHVGSSIDLEGF
jgi:phage gp36-like protein